VGTVLARAVGIKAVAVKGRTMDEMVEEMSKNEPAEVIEPKYVDFS